ncbi:MAG TPA: hypothetical protein VNE40_00720 [Candidatus Dormibacteraeota bacterium]|nr:hypothetical protein [Candidatus Dormibacteraeota bacterium]
MWQLYTYSLLAGLVGANGIPNFIKGIMGHKFQTPFGKPSSAVVNVIWGWLNFVVAFLLLYSGHVHAHLLRAFALVAIGALLAAVALASVSSKQPMAKH